MKPIRTDDGNGNVEPLDVYLMGDEPQCCPKCGKRTEFEDIPQEDNSIVQRHNCTDNNCRYEFIVEEEDEKDKTMVDFNCTREEIEVVEKIADRVESMDGGETLDRMTLMMDIEACHSNGCKLKLQELLDADYINFMHDINGIQRHLDRETGKLLDCFSPIYSKQEG